MTQPEKTPFDEAETTDTPEAGAENVKSAPEEAKADVAKAPKKAKAPKAPTPKTPLVEAQESAEPDLTKQEIADIDAEEKKFDKITGSTEEKIEGLRDVTNNLIKLANKIVDRNANGRSSAVLDQKIQFAGKTLTSLMQQYSDENKSVNYKVVIEREGLQTLVIDCGPSKDEAYGLCSDIREQVNELLRINKDSLITVVSSQSESTIIAEARVSTISAFSAQLYDSAPEYKPKKELQPLDRAMMRQPQAQALSGPVGLLA